MHANSTSKGTLVCVNVCKCLCLFCLYICLEQFCLPRGSACTRECVCGVCACVCARVCVVCVVEKTPSPATHTHYLHILARAQPLSPPSQHTHTAHLLPLALQLLPQQRSATR